MATPLPENGAAFTLAEAVLATGGEARGGDRSASFVTTDSRMAREGALFVALRGERFDGSRFARAAAEKGAAIVVTDRADAADEAVTAGASAVVVRDVLEALGALAAHHRARWQALGGKRIVAVAGSAGKTTTTRALACVLAGDLGAKVHATPGNLNNRVGVPMTLLALRPEHEITVLELGTNELGEVPALVRIAAPDVGVLTLVGLEHTEGLGSLDQIEEEEGALVRAVGAAAGNGDDERVVRQLERSPGARFRWGFGEGADVRIARYESRGIDGSRVVLALSGEELALDVPLLGRAGALAAAAVVTTIRFTLGLNIGAQTIERGLADAARSAEGRLVPSRAAGAVLLDDSYNANPPSMRSSIELAREVADREDKALVLVLGEMRELGDRSVAEHVALAEVVLAARPARVLCVGGDAIHLHEALAAAGTTSAFYATSEDAADDLGDASGAVVLVKGSRGVRTEIVARAIAGEGR